MCYGVLEEINQVKKCEESRQQKLPQPHYLFVQKYGRNLEAEMPEIAAKLGNGTWFSFCTEGKKKDVSITNRFLVELEKHAELGKKFGGCALVELTGGEEPKELFEFLSYIRQQESGFGSVFSTRSMDCVDDIRKSLEQHFFVRVIDGEKYDSTEQVLLFLNVLESFGFSLEGTAYNAVEEIFSNINWEETDMVRNKIENLARNMVYEKLMLSEEGQVVSAEEIKTAAAGLKKETEKVRKIGFVGGMAYE